MNRISHVVWFIAFVVVASIVTFVVMNRANKSLEKSHKAIIEEYKSSAHLTYDLMKTCVDLQNDSSKDSIANKKLANRIEEASAMLASRENDQKTLSLLELEFSKIQNEYEVLNLWCALLTVVFLIFSFFSLIKTNELEKQGEQALSDLRDTANQAQNKSDSIDQKLKDAQTAISQKEEEIIKDFKDKIDKKTTDIKKLQETTMSSLGELQGKMNDGNREVQELKNGFSGMKGEKDKWVEELKSLIEKERTEIPELIKSTAESEVNRLVKEHSERINSLERGLNELRAIINRSPTTDDSEVTDDEMIDVVEETEMEGITEDEDNSASIQTSNTPEV